MNQAIQFIRFAAAVFMLSSPSGLANAAGDIQMGKKVFTKCSACHNIGEGAKNSIGPVLTGVVGRKIGIFPGYSYGRSMREANKTGLVWTEKNLDDWLTDPNKFLRKVLESRKARAKMRFKLKEKADRKNVIAFLKTIVAASKTESMESKPNVSAAVARPAMAISPGDVCVENQSDKILLFVVDVNGGKRLLQTLRPSQNLCAPEAGDGGTVGVFQDEDALEGCSRLAKAGKAERLVAYDPFDNCTWAG